MTMLERMGVIHPGWERSPNVLRAPVVGREGAEFPGELVRVALANREATESALQDLARHPQGRNGDRSRSERVASRDVAAIRIVKLARRVTALFLNDAHGVRPVIAPIRCCKLTRARRISCFSMSTFTATMAAASALRIRPAGVDSSRCCSSRA